MLNGGVRILLCAQGVEKVNPCWIRGVTIGDTGDFLFRGSGTNGFVLSSNSSLSASIVGDRVSGNFVI